MGPSPSDDKVFLIDYSGYDFETRLSPLEYAVEAYKQLEGPITVMLSGGVDSQASAYAAKASGRKDVRFVSYVYNGGLNYYDLRTDFYSMHDINIEYLSIDLIDFHETELIEWAQKYQCGSPHILSHMKLASLHRGTNIIFSGNISNSDQDRLGFNTVGLERYSDIEDRNVTGYFFNAVPNVFYGLWHKSDYSERDFYTRKVKTFHAGGFPVIPQRKKLHGFEQLKTYYDGAHIPPSTVMAYKHLPSKRPYDLLFRYPINKYTQYYNSTALYPDERK